MSVQISEMQFVLGDELLSLLCPIKNSECKKMYVTDFLHQNCVNEFSETKKNVCMATKPYTGRLINSYIVHNFFLKFARSSSTLRCRILVSDLNDNYSCTCKYILRIWSPIQKCNSTVWCNGWYNLDNKN